MVSCSRCIYSFLHFFNAADFIFLQKDQGLGQLFQIVAFRPPCITFGDKLCAVIDGILLNEKPAAFEAFLQKLEQQGYEIKRDNKKSRNFRVLSSAVEL